MFEGFRREREVRRALKAISGQRVAIVLQPGNVQVIERSPPKEEWFELGVQTCLIRGWVEVLHADLPTGMMKFSGSNPVFPEQITPTTHYRLTEGGWAVLNRSHAWIVATFLISAVGLVVAVASLLIAWLALPGGETSRSGQRATSSNPSSLHSIAEAVTPNPSLKRSANGRPPGPVWRYGVHFRQPGPGVLPSSPA
jgi:hypothetical protein